MELQNLRQQIDYLDKGIIDLIGKRFEVVEKVANYKKIKGFDVLQTKRWSEVLKTRKTQAKEVGINEDMIENIWNTLHDYAILKEKEIINN